MVKVLLKECQRVIFFNFIARKLANQTVKCFVRCFNTFVVELQSIVSLLFLGRKVFFLGCLGQTPAR